MRISDWAQKFNLAVKRCEERPDHPQGEIVYRVKEIFTTLLGSWDPSSDYGAIPQWARDAYLKPWGAATTSKRGGRPQPVRPGARSGRQAGENRKQVRYWSDGFDKLGMPATPITRGLTPSPVGLGKIDIWSNFSPERGEQGAWSWCPEGAADVVVGGGMPNNHHVSTFVVWQAERREAVQPDPTPTPTPTLPPPSVA